MLGCILPLLKPSSQECGGGRETGSSNLLSTWVTSPCLSDQPSIHFYHTGNKTIFLRGKEALGQIVNPFTYSLPMNVESVSKGRVSVAPECLGHNWASFAEANIPSRVERIREGDLGSILQHLGSALLTVAMNILSQTFLRTDRVRSQTL